MSRPGSSANAGQRERVRVFVRCRPEVEHQSEEGGNGKLELFPSDKNIKVTKDFDEKTFSFDGVFPIGTSQEDVYNATARPVLEDAFKGFFGTILAYGQTGTGKTFTLSNPTPGNEGIIQRVVSDIFTKIENDAEECEHVIRVNYVQIYNELLQDLLNPESNNLQIRNDPSSGVFISDVTTLTVTTAEEALAIWESGNENRSVALTSMNANSSRSHSCFIIFIERRYKVTRKELEASGSSGASSSSSSSSKAAVRKVLLGKIFLVDLAGSERIKKTGVTGDRLEEAKAINGSLSALGNVIHALTDPKISHVPFRDSKLTRLLQDSLGGSGKTSLVVTIAPEAWNLTESLSSMLFGQRAMKVTNVAKVTEAIDYKALAVQLQDQLDQREDKIRLIEQQIGLAMEMKEQAVEERGAMKVENDAIKKEMEELRAAWTRELDTMRETNEIQVQKMREEYETNAAEMNAAHEALVQQMMEDNQREIETMIGHLDQHVSEHAIHLEEKENESQRLRSERDALRTERAALSSQLAEMKSKFDLAEKKNAQDKEEFKRLQGLISEMKQHVQRTAASAASAAASAAAVAEEKKKKEEKEVVVVPAPQALEKEPASQALLQKEEDQEEQEEEEEDLVAALASLTYQSDDAIEKMRSALVEEKNAMEMEMSRRIHLIEIELKESNRTAQELGQVVQQCNVLKRDQANKIQVLEDRCREQESDLERRAAENTTLRARIESLSLELKVLRDEVSLLSDKSSQQSRSDLDARLSLQRDLAHAREQQQLARRETSALHALCECLFDMMEHSKQLFESMLSASALFVSSSSSSSSLSPLFSASSHSSSLLQNAISTAIIHQNAQLTSSLFSIPSQFDSSIETLLLHSIPSSSSLTVSSSSGPPSPSPSPSPRSSSSSASSSKQFSIIDSALGSKLSSHFTSSSSASSSSSSSLLIPSEKDRVSSSLLSSLHSRISSFTSASPIPESLSTLHSTLTSLQRVPRDEIPPPLLRSCIIPPSSASDQDLLLSFLAPKLTPSAHTQLDNRRRIFFASSSSSSLSSSAPSFAPRIPRLPDELNLTAEYIEQMDAIALEVSRSSCDVLSSLVSHLHTCLRSLVTEIAIERTSAATVAAALQVVDPLISMTVNQRNESLSACAALIHALEHVGTSLHAKTSELEKSRADFETYKKRKQDQDTERTAQEAEHLKFDSAARVIQRFVRRQKRRMEAKKQGLSQLRLEREKQIREEQDKKLAETKAFLENVNSGTGHLLMRQAYADVSNVFSTLFHYFLEKDDTAFDEWVASFDAPSPSAGASGPSSQAAPAAPVASASASTSSAAAVAIPSSSSSSSSSKPSVVSFSSISSLSLAAVRGRSATVAAGSSAPFASTPPAGSSVPNSSSNPSTFGGQSSGSFGQAFGGAQANTFGSHRPSFIGQSPPPMFGKPLSSASNSTPLSK